MEKYAAIYKTINDKIASQEDIIEMYRRETTEKDALIRELKAKVSDLELALCDETQKNNELENSYEKKLDEISELKVANAKLIAKINELEKF